MIYKYLMDQKNIFISKIKIILEKVMPALWFIFWQQTKQGIVFPSKQTLQLKYFYKIIAISCDIAFFCGPFFKILFVFFLMEMMLGSAFPNKRMDIIAVHLKMTFALHIFLHLEMRTITQEIYRKTLFRTCFQSVFTA